MQLKIKVEPTAKGRPKVRMMNGKVWTFTPKKTQDAEEAIRHSVNGIVPYPAGIPLKMVVTFYRQKSQWLHKHEDKPFRKPDIVNFVALLCDALNGVAYADDSQLTFVTMRKRWTKQSQELSRKKRRTAECQGYIVCSIMPDKGV